METSSSSDLRPTNYLAQCNSFRAIFIAIIVISYFLHTRISVQSVPTSLCKYIYKFIFIFNKPSYIVALSPLLPAPTKEGKGKASSICHFSPTALSATSKKKKLGILWNRLKENSVLTLKIEAAHWIWLTAIHPGTNSYWRQAQRQSTNPPSKSYWLS